MGIPVIAANESGAAEIIRSHPNSGYILERSTPDVLAEKLRRLIADSTLRAQVGLEGRRVCEQIFDSRHNAALLREVCDSVLIRMSNSVT
ncbi:MAG: glycosyltransferase [Bryobacterales bacterium]|nr:glycosyltransferase [Bryobacterales bacterium]